jgi:hypothetical protein
LIIIGHKKKAGIAAGLVHGFEKYPLVNPKNLNQIWKIPYGVEVFSFRITLFKS